MSAHWHPSITQFFICTSSGRGGGKYLTKTIVNNSCELTVGDDILDPVSDIPKIVYASYREVVLVPDVMIAGNGSQFILVCPVTNSHGIHSGKHLCLQTQRCVYLSLHSFIAMLYGIHIGYFPFQLSCSWHHFYLYLMPGFSFNNISKDVCTFGPSTNHFQHAIQHFISRVRTLY